MQKNMGCVDRILRILIAIVIAILYFTGQITGTAAIILGIIAITFILTSITGFCPMYVPLKLSTCKAPEKAEEAPKAEEPPKPEEQAGPSEPPAPAPEPPQQDAPPQPEEPSQPDEPPKPETPQQP